MAVNRKLNGVNAPIQKKGKPKHRLSASEKLAARKAYAQYKKKRSGADKKFDLARAKFRAGHKRGRKLAPGAKLRIAKKAALLNRKAGALRHKLKLKGKLGKKDAAALKALQTKAKKVYSGNRKRVQASAKQRAHDMVGNAMVRANKIIAAAAKTKDPAKMEAAKVRAGKLLTAAKNKAIRTIQDTRRDLTTMRKAAGRNTSARRRGPRPGVGAAGIKGNKITPPVRKNTAPKGSNPTPGGAPAAASIPQAPKKDKGVRGPDKKPRMYGTRAGVGTFSNKPIPSPRKPFVGTRAGVASGMFSKGGLGGPKRQPMKGTRAGVGTFVNNPV